MNTFEHRSKCAHASEFTPNVVSLSSNFLLAFWNSTIFFPSLEIYDVLWLWSYSDVNFLASFCVLYWKHGARESIATHQIAMIKTIFERHLNLLYCYSLRYLTFLTLYIIFLCESSPLLLILSLSLSFCFSFTPSIKSQIYASLICIILFINKSILSVVAKQWPIPVH